MANRLSSSITDPRGPQPRTRSPYRWRRSSWGPWRAKAVAGVRGRLQIRSLGLRGGVLERSAPRASFIAGRTWGGCKSPPGPGAACTRPTLSHWRRRGAPDRALPARRTGLCTRTSGPPIPRSRPPCGRPRATSGAGGAGCRDVTKRSAQPGAVRRAACRCPLAVTWGSSPPASASSPVRPVLEP